MTYDCPLDRCPETFETSEAAAVHVRYDHQVRYPTDDRARDDFMDKGIHAPPPPYHRAWNERIPTMRPRKVA